jgi:short subunit dehydrogenase-like uncharacterized protein
MLLPLRTNMVRPFDVVLFGATGFTGTLVARELAARSVGGALRWAIAGRDRDKLERVRSEVSARCPTLTEPGVIVARSDDPNALASMAAQTRVVATTVGPYDLLGDALVAACVETRTDYVDITGEPTFWKRTIAQQHERAAERGVLVVSCCGFDSIPHDLGAYFVAKQLARAAPGTDGPLEIDAFVRVSGSPSGGTWASAINALANIRSRGGGAGDRPNTARPRIHHEPAVDQWVVPFPSVDPLVVRRSARYCEIFGTAFTYRHYLQVKSLPKLAQLIAGVGVVTALAQTKPTRALLLRWRGSGEGPSDDERAQSKFVVTLLGRAGDRRVRVEVSGRDPGYGLTAMMLTEAALTLAQDRERLPHRGGVLTPASGLHEPLLERVQRGGLSFRLVGDL